MTIIPDMRCGMDADLRAAIRRQVPVTGSFPRGRTYTWHRDRVSTWEELHWEVARTLRRGAGSFYITFQDQPVQLDRALPQVPDGPIRIGLRTGEYPAGNARPTEAPRHRSPEREQPECEPDQPQADRRSRSRDRQSPPSSRSPVRARWWTRLSSTPRTVTDEDQVLCHLATQHGQLQLPLYLQDFHAVNWTDVPLEQASRRLLQVYGALLPYPTRLTFADVEYRCWRPGDTVADVAANGQCWIVPCDAFGSNTGGKRRRQAVWNEIKQAQQSISDKVECTFIVETARGIVPYAHEVPVGVPFNHATMQTELNQRRARLRLPAKKYLILDVHNHLLPMNTSTMVDCAEEGKKYVFKVLEAPTFGSNSPAELPEGTKQQAAAIRKIIRGQIRGNQLRLLLKGDVNFLNRAKKVCHDEKRLTSLVLETAKRYHMNLLDTRDEASAVTTQTRPSSRKPTGQTAATSLPSTTKEKAVKPVTLSLPEKHWSHAPMEAFRLGIEGVYLEPTMESAVAHSKQLSGAKGAVALLTMQPLAHARKVEKVTFTMQRQRADDRPSQSLAEGYLNQFGTARH